MIYLLRHGQTEYNVERRIQGRCDSPLTKLGEDQARGMGACLRERIGDGSQYQLVSSPLGRAVASAELVREAAGLSRPVIIDARLAEIGCGSWERHRYASLAARDPAIGDAPNFLAAWALYCTDGESLEAASDRLGSFLAWADGKNVVVVSHGCAGSILRSLYLGTGRAEMLNRHSAPQSRLYRIDAGEVEEIACA